MTRRSTLPLAVVAALALPSLALADNFELYGYGPRAAAMGGAHTAEANDYTAVFYNPALLVDRKDVNFGFAFQWNRMSSSVDVKDRARADELDCTYCTAPDTAGFSTGLLFPLGGKVKNHLALGLGLYLPHQRLLRLLAPDSNRPYWYRYNSNPDRIVVHLGAGIKVADWFKIGIGVQALADLVGAGASVKVDLFSKTVEQREIDSGLNSRIAPVVGLELAPLKQLRLGVTWRSEMKLVYQIPASVDLSGVGTLSFEVAGVAHYTPHTIAFGVAYDITDDLTVALDGEWAMWHMAPSPYTDLTIDLSGATLDALGLGSALDIQSPAQAPGFSDTLTARLGGEYRIGDNFSARLGAFYRPTPVPRQDVAGTNLLDCSVIGVTAGLGVSFPEPLEVLQGPVKIDFAAQAAFGLPREAAKDPVDNVPAYTYSANVYGLTAAVRYDF